jgi:hypothetical protein
MGPRIDPENDSENRSIYDLARECASLFTEYLSAPRLHRQFIAQSQRRFWSWVAFLGVFAHHDVCLDTRLKYKPDIHGLVILLLGVLMRNMRRGAAPAENSQASGLKLIW